MDSVTHDGRSTSYRRTDFGEEPRVCYVHGSGGTHRAWAHQYGDRDGPPAVAVDLSGHGDSDDVATDAGRETLEAYGDDVVAVCGETDATVLCGNSLGGAVALWIALERDLALEGLVLADTGAKLGVDDGLLESLDRNFEGAVSSLHAPDALFHDPAEDLVEPSVESLLGTGRAVTLRDFETCDAFDVRDRLDEVGLPALAICGEHDRLTPRSFHEYLTTELPDCDFVEVADAAHMPMLERPAAFNEHVRSFLADL